MASYILASSDRRVRATLDTVRGGLDLSGATLLEIDASRVPRRDREGRVLADEFKHTPGPLLDVWRSARHLAAETVPGDIVVASDHHGLAGVFALMQAAAPPAERRELWTIAADSAFLEMRLIARAHEGLPQPLDGAIDWEVVQYQYSGRVHATSARAVTELAQIGVFAEIVTTADDSSEPRFPELVSEIWVPGAVSRRSQVGDILRAVSSMDRVWVTLSNMDSDDQIWTGSTWEALRHVREVLGNRVRRGDRPSTKPDVIVIGDPYAPPDRPTRAFRAEGVAVVVPTGSVSSKVWPDAPVWSSADELVDVLKGSSRGSRFPVPGRRVVRDPSPGRASRVSVGIPVFRDIRFLEQCVESILAQELGPAEILLIDDGSSSASVDETLETWEHRDPLIRVIRTHHRGVCVARNTALEQMGGDSFLFLDSDDFIEPTFLSKCANVLRSDEDIWAVATWTRFFGDYQGVEAKPPFDQRVGRRENPIISTAALVDIGVRERSIRFEPDLAFLYCEDWHFWSQIVAAGGRIGLVPEPLAHHRTHHGSGGYMRSELAHAIGKARATEPLRADRDTY